MAENFTSSDKFFRMKEYRGVKCGRVRTSPVFFEFHEEHWKNKELILRTCEILGLPIEDNAEITQINYISYDPGVAGKEIRGWHVDTVDKKFQYILYLGQNTEYTTIQFHDGNRVFSLPFRHNTLVFWKNTDHSFHRYFETTEERKTINLVATYV